MMMLVALGAEVLAWCAARWACGPAEVCCTYLVLRLDVELDLLAGQGADSGIAPGVSR